MSTVSLALVGCGRIGCRHAEALRGVPGARLAAVCDPPAPAAAERLAVEHGAAVATSLEELCAAGDVVGGVGDIDAVILATPSGLHQQQAAAILAAGKHVLVEKPAALSTAGARALAAAADHRGLVAAAVHPLRFWPPLQRACEFLKAGGLGRLSHAVCNVRLNRGAEYYASSPWRGRRALDGGMLFNQAIHHFDLLLWWLGEPEWVFAAAATRLQATETEDVVVGAAGLAGGGLVSFDVTTSAYGRNLEERIIVFGDKGTLVTGGASMYEPVEYRTEAGREPAPSGDHERSGDRAQIGLALHQAVLADFVHAIAAHVPPRVSLREAARSLAFVEALYESAAAGRRVTVSAGDSGGGRNDRTNG